HLFSTCPFFTLRRPHTSPPFPYTTLFRSIVDVHPLGEIERRPDSGRCVGGNLDGDGHAREKHRPGIAAGDVLGERGELPVHAFVDRKSTRLNSSHVKISYAVFCLKKKKTT